MGSVSRDMYLFDNVWTWNSVFYCLEITFFRNFLDVFVVFWPMSSSFNDTSSPCKSKVVGKVVGSRPIGLVHSLLVKNKFIIYYGFWPCLNQKCSKSNTLQIDVNNFGWLVSIDHYWN